MKYKELVPKDEYDREVIAAVENRLNRSYAAVSTLEKRKAYN